MSEVVSRCDRAARPERAGSSNKPLARGSSKNRYLAYFPKFLTWNVRKGFIWPFDIRNHKITYRGWRFEIDGEPHSSVDMFQPWSKSIKLPTFPWLKGRLIPKTWSITVLCSASNSSTIVDASVAITTQTEHPAPAVEKPLNLQTFKKPLDTSSLKVIFITFLFEIKLFRNLWRGISKSGPAIQFVCWWKCQPPCWILFASLLPYFPSLRRKRNETGYIQQPFHPGIEYPTCIQQA